MVAVTLRRRRPARDAQPHHRRQAPCRSWAGAPGGTLRPGARSRRARPRLPRPLVPPDAGDHGPSRQRRPGRAPGRGGRQQRELGDRDRLGNHAARQRAQPPADRRPRVQRMDRRRARRAKGHQPAGSRDHPSDRHPRLARRRRRHPRRRPSAARGRHHHNRRPPRARRDRAGGGGRRALSHRLGRALGRPRHLPVRGARPGPRAGGLAGRPRRRAHRVRHVELRARSPRGPCSAIRGPAEAERPP